jgi:predicted phage tail component-like protein
MSYNITFNGYTLQDVSFRTTIIQHTGIPDKTVQIQPRSRNDGSIVVNVKYNTRKIQVEGQLSQADRNSLVAKIDEMKTNLNGVSGTLLIDYGNTQRMYYGTVTKLDIDEDFYNINFTPYKIEFTCADPFGYTTTSGIAFLPAVTNMLQDVVLTVSGSINTDPVAYITINTATNMSLLTLSNETTGEKIVISKPGGNFSNGDQIVINSKLKQVQINASGIDYTGRFPLIAPPTAQLRVQIQATNVNYDLTYRYVPTYL